MVRALLKISDHLLPTAGRGLRPRCNDQAPTDDDGEVAGPGIMEVDGIEYQKVVNSR